MEKFRFTIDGLSNNRQTKLLQKNTNSEKEVIITKNEKEIKIITCGNVDPEQMSEEERKVFYATLLVRAIELYRKQREEVK